MSDINHPISVPRPGIFMVYCVKTKGEFSTKVWDYGVARGKCPICGAQIE